MTEPASKDEIKSPANKEGQERLNSSKALKLPMPPDFDYDTGKFFVYPSASFSVLFLEPKTGDILTGVEAGPTMKREKSLILYTPMIKESEEMLTLYTYKFEVEGRQMSKSGHAWFKYENGKWSQFQSGMPSMTSAAQNQSDAIQLIQ